jgi:hypothetical protein
VWYFNSLKARKRLIGAAVTPNVYVGAACIEKEPTELAVQNKNVRADTSRRQ